MDSDAYGLHPINVEQCGGHCMPSTSKAAETSYPTARNPDNFFGDDENTSQISKAPIVEDSRYLLRPDFNEAEADSRVASLLDENARYIKIFKRVSRRVQDRYNFEITDINPSNLEQYLLEIYREQKHPFL